MSLPFATAALVAAGAVVLIMRHRRLRTAGLLAQAPAPAPCLASAPPAQAAPRTSAAAALRTDVLGEVLKHLDRVSLARACAVAKTWAEAGRQDQLWRAYIIQQYWSSLHWDYVHPQWRGQVNWCAKMHEQSVFAQRLRTLEAEAPDDAVDAYLKGTLSRWGVNWRDRYHMMTAAHSPWDLQWQHRRALEDDFEFRSDVMYEANRGIPADSSTTPHNRTVVRHLLGDAPIKCGIARYGFYPGMTCTFKSLVTASNRPLQTARELETAHLEHFPGDNDPAADVPDLCRSRLLLNVFARRRSDGKVAHILRLVSNDLDSISTNHSRTVMAEHDGFDGFQKCLLHFICAPPKLNDISDQALQKGLGWFVRASVQSDTVADSNGQTRFKIELEDFRRLDPSFCRGGSVTNSNSVMDDDENRVEWSGLRDLVEKSDSIDWFTP